MRQKITSQARAVYTFGKPQEKQKKNKGKLYGTCTNKKSKNSRAESTVSRK